MDLTFERLLEWVEGRLSPEEADRVAQEVATAGEEIQAQVQWLRAFVKLGNEVVLAVPPPSVRVTLTGYFKEYAQQQRPPSLFQKLLASLTFDSTLQPAAAGMRTATSEQTRQLLFSTDLVDIALNLQRRISDQRIDLLGQILPRVDSIVVDEFAVQLLCDEREIAILMPDELGEFVVEALEAGSYQLLFSTEKLEISSPVFALAY